MRVTGWRLPAGAAEPGGELRASGVDASLVVVHAEPAGADRLFALLAQCLYGPPFPGPGEVTLWDGSSSRAVRPADQPAAGEGPTPAARQSEARRGWAHLVGQRPADDEVARERERLLLALAELDRRLLATRGPTDTAAVIDLRDDSPPAATTPAEPGPLAALADIEEGLAEDDEHGAIATERLGKLAAELSRFAGLPSRAELVQTRRRLEELDAALATARTARTELDAATTTAAVLELALAPLPAAPSPSLFRRLLQPVALVGAVALIAAAAALLVAGRSGAGAIVGLVAFAVAVVALVAPSVPAQPPRQPLFADRDKVSRHLALARQRRDEQRDLVTTSDVSAARLANEVQLPSLPTEEQLARRLAELDAVEAERRDADKLANTVDAALVDLETKRANARQQALAAAARRAGLDKLPDTTLPGQPQTTEADGEARRRHLKERLELTRRVLTSALNELEGRHPTLLTRAATRFAQAADGLRIEAVNDHGPVIVPSGQADDGADPAAPQWSLLADLCLTVEATSLAAGDRPVPLILGAVRLGDSGRESAGETDRVAAIVAAEADVRQIVVITSDSASYQRLLAGRSDAAGVELASIRVLVTPPE